MNPALDEASRRQANAADPHSSAWVSANAGSGKTHVLTQRVLRLLLAGVAPSKILCLTFTKAAAANMAERVFGALSKWPTLSDEKLTAAILATGAPAPKLPEREQARRLFARVIETPGGLKIQTIHAFCERVLHMFPFEANAPAGFRPLDEREAAQVRARAQAKVFDGTAGDPELGAALARVAEIVGADGFASLIAQTARLSEALAAHGDPQAYAAALAQRLGLAPGETEPSIAREMREGGGGPPVWLDWAKALRRGLATDQKLAAMLTDAAAMEGDVALDVYLQVFLVKELTAPRKAMATKRVIEACPAEAAALAQERDRLFALLDRRRAARAVARSRDLMQISRACEAAYARAKAARGALDFDDLIVKTAALFQNTDAAWVLYKLDRGVEHILVDEAQDTSQAQWSILQKLAEDFLSGKSSSPSHRSFFAVGDEKQSIFSFQGAAPHLFDEMRRAFATGHRRAERAFADERLTHSFRSAPVVLQAVEHVFGVPEVWRGVSASGPTIDPHVAIHGGLPGVVELWPQVPAEPAPDPGDWAAPLDAQRLTHPAVTLAERIAGVIAQWTAPGSPERILDDPRTGALRPIRPGDILILVRRRGPLFEALTRALRRAGIATAGADRLTLAAHIAVLDLCAAARAALNPDDDLALAGALKSPLIGLDDEALIRLAPQRPGSLAAALAADPAYASAQAALQRWRTRAQAGPFAFFAHLVGADGGRQALVGRIGPEAGDVIDELLARALAHERGEAPSLRGFLAEIEEADSQIKRDMEAAGAQVRVMTVHASKGLEAPIVFLPDTSGAPSGRHDPKWLKLAPAHSAAAPLYVWANAAGEDNAAMAGARDEARAIAAGEFRRLLYVAMTRAAQRLIVAGYQGARENPAECWFNLIARGLDPHLSDAPAWWDPAQSLRRLGEGARSVAPAPVAAASSAPAPPAWASAPAPHEVRYAPPTPSRRLAGALTPDRLARIEEGRLAHRLLQSLPGLPAQRRRSAAQAYLERRAEPLARDRRLALVERVLALIEAPALAPLFGPGSRAEVPFVAQLGGETRTGRIDRLGVTADSVWIADFKTGAAAMRREYVRQLAIYRAAIAPMFPGVELRVFLLWIDSGTFEELESMTLQQAYQD